MNLFGRRVIKTDQAEITSENVINVLNKALIVHLRNKAEIEYLYAYYKGRQPILKREKQVRPEIANKIVENRAYEIVTFMTGYLMGEPVQYVARNENSSTGVNELNDYIFAEEKASKDKELVDWFHICGTAFRMILPDREAGLDEDESPFEIFTLDPRYTFVVYYNDGMTQKPILGVKYVVNENGEVIYSCYTKDTYYEIMGTNSSLQNIVKEETHILGGIPIVEYPLNFARLGAFEVVVPLLDAINLCDSNRQDGVEQFVQALLVLHNVELDDKGFQELLAQGAIKYKDIDPQLKGEIEYLVNSLNQSETQTLVDHMYQVVLTITGMPNRNGGTSTSDTGTAVIYRDGWSAAESRAKDTELMFKKSERQFLRIALNICNTTMKDKLGIKVSDVEIRFTRRNYENIAQKAQVLDLMLKNPKIDPKLAFEHCGMFADPGLAYARSLPYIKKAEAMNELDADTTDDRDDSPNPEEGKPSGDQNRAGEDSDY